MRTRGKSLQVYLGRKCLDDVEAGLLQVIEVKIDSDDLIDICVMSYVAVIITWLAPYVWGG